MNMKCFHINVPYVENVLYMYTAVFFKLVINQFNPSQFISYLELLYFVIEYVRRKDEKVCFCYL